MKLSKEEKRASLIAKAEELVDEYLAWEEHHLKPETEQLEGVEPDIRLENRRSDLLVCITPIARGMLSFMLSVTNRLYF